jgi:putative ABC transport system substrate-binding protein
MRRRDFIKGIAGSVTSWPLAARAQQHAAPVVGFLHFGTRRTFEYQVTAFNQGLKDTDYVDGQNVAIEYRWAEGRYD